MVEEKEVDEESEAKFNMALDSLKRLGDISREIKIASAEVSIPIEERQSIKIGLVRQFVIQSDPLLDETTAKTYTDKALKLKNNYIKVVNRGGVFLYNKLVYKPSLDDTLDKLIVEVQRELAKKKMFMPPVDDSGLF